MVLPGHLAGGYLAATALIAIFHPDLSQAQLGALLLIGTISGELPDVDTIFPVIGHILKKNPRESHRDHITHTPFFWIILISIVIIAGYISGSRFTTWLGWILIAGVMMHFILDSIEWGIRWVWPLSNRRFYGRFPKNIEDELIGIKPGTIKYYLAFTFGPYRKTWTFYLEIAITCIALFVFFKSF